MADEKKTKVILKVSVSDADGYGGAGAPGDELEVPADVAERLVAAGIAAAAGTTPAAKPAEETPAENGGGATGRRRSSS